MSNSAEKKPKKSLIERLAKLRTRMRSKAMIDEATAFEIAVKLYSIAHDLRADVDEWQRFCEQGDWVGVSPRPQPKVESREKALHFATRFAVGLKKEAIPNRVRKFQDILKNAWDENKAVKEIGASVKKIQAEKRYKAAETRAKRKATAVRSIKLVPSEASRLIIRKGGRLTLTGEFTVTDAGGPAMSVEITRLKDKSVKKLVVSKPANSNAVGK